MSEFNEQDHPRDGDGKFTSKGEKTVEAIRLYSNDTERDLQQSNMLSAAEMSKILQQEMPNRKFTRIKVGEITNPIYDDMVLSNGRNVKDILTRVVEMPLTGSVGVEHIENHPERKGMVEHYIGFMNDIINDPDFVFEDKARENTLVIEKKVDKHTVMVISLNFDKPDYTNTVITIRNEGNESFERSKKSYENLGKVLYKNSKV